MLILSIIMILVGILLVVRGSQHITKENQMKYLVENWTNDNMGEMYLGIGLVVGIIGIILLIVAIVNKCLAYSKKLNKENDIENNIVYSKEYYSWLSNASLSSTYSDNWKCTCGIINADYVGSCACGRTKESVKNNSTSNCQKTSQKNSKLKSCNRCGKNLPARARFCDVCGVSLKEKICSNCGLLLTFDTIFCMECGQKYVENNDRERL